MLRLPQTCVVAIGLGALLLATATGARAQAAAWDPPEETAPALPLDIRPFAPMKRYTETAARIQGQGVGPSYWLNTEAAQREMGPWDPDGYLRTAQLYSGTNDSIEPRFRGYLESVKFVDPSFRAALVTARKRLEVARLRPDDAQRQGVRDALAALQKRVSFLTSSNDLATQVETYGEALATHARQQMELIPMRVEQVSRKRRSEEGSDKVLEDAGQRMRDMHPGTPIGQRSSEQPDDRRPSNPNSLPPSGLLLKEQGALIELSPRSAAALFVLPSLQACVTTMKAVDGELTSLLRAATTRADIDQQSVLLTLIERRWTWLTGYAAKCSDPRLWSI